MRRRQAIALLALVGFCIALYLWFYKIGIIGKLQCGSGSCEYVQTSRYGALFGVPVAFYGVVGYAVIFAVAIAGLQPSQLARRWPTTALALLSVGGLLYLTVHAALQGGVDILTVLSGLVLALFGFGIVGALLHPPDR